MVFEEEMKIGIEDVGKNALITNRTILRILENIGGYHSDKVGYGLLDIERNGVTWITCNYAFQDNKHIVVFKNEDTINSIVELWN